MAETKSPDGVFQRRCLKCDKLFKPADRTRNWFCNKCKRKNEVVGGADDVSTTELRMVDPNFDAEC